MTHRGQRESIDLAENDAAQARQPITDAAVSNVV